MEHEPEMRRMSQELINHLSILRQNIDSIPDAIKKRLDNGTQGVALAEDVKISERAKLKEAWNNVILMTGMFMEAIRSKGADYLKEDDIIFFEDKKKELFDAINLIDSVESSERPNPEDVLKEINDKLDNLLV